VLVQAFLALIALLGALVVVCAPEERSLEASGLRVWPVWSTLFLGLTGAEVFLFICAVFYTFVWGPLFNLRDENGNIIWR